MNVTMNLTWLRNGTRPATTRSCPLNLDQQYVSDMLHITVGLLILNSQLFNLIVFHIWRNKEPYILLHTALAWISLLKGTSHFADLLVRTVSRALLVTRSPTGQQASETLAKLVLFGLIWLGLLDLTMLVGISVDRWLSVEWAVAYRNRVSRRAVKVLAALCVTASLIIGLPGIVVYWPSVSIVCGHTTLNTRTPGQGPVFKVWPYFLGPVQVRPRPGHA